MTVHPSTTLADLVIEDGRRARVLERFHLDYCCNGDRRLSDAVADAHADLESVTKALDLPEADHHEAGGPRNRAALAHDIVDTHHAYMWQEMPRLQALVKKVHQVHGMRHPELARVDELFTEAVTALDPHMTNEERSVFPAISRMERTGAAPAASTALADQIHVLVQEHTLVGDLFKEINTLTSGYTVPDDGCASYRAMLEGLEEMEFDLHEHIHKENNILFPDALELERVVAAG